MEDHFEAKVYHVKDDWTISIKSDNEDNETVVYRIHKDGSEEKLHSIASRKFDSDGQPVQNEQSPRDPTSLRVQIASGVAQAATRAIIEGIIDLIQAACGL